MSKFWTLFYVVFIISSNAFAQVDSTSTRTKFLHPDYVKMQFAGEIGFLSVGIGTEFFKKRNGELDLMLGYLPKSIGGDNITTIALKFTYIPWTKDIIKGKLLLQPLTLGVIAYHAFGKDLNKISNKDLYPQNYYWWTLGMRFGPILGFRVIKKFEESSKIKALALYIEFGTNDLYIYSWGVNTSVVPLQKIINTSFGLKANF